MKSSVVNRSIKIAGHKTSVTLEDKFWKALREIAAGRNTTLSDLIAAIDSERQLGNLSSAIRLFVLGFYRNQISDPRSTLGTEATKRRGLIATTGWNTGRSQVAVSKPAVSDIPHS